jgi:hypothetical protein
VRVVFVVCLILVIFDLDEVWVHGIGVEGQWDECVDSGGLGNDLERPWLQTSVMFLATQEAILTYLLILELDQVSVVLDDLIALVLARLEKLGQGKPLSSHLVAVIGIDLRDY